MRVIGLLNFSVVLPQGGGGVLQIPRVRDDQRIFLGLKFFIFLGVGKFGKYFLGWLDLSRDFFGYSKQSEDSW